jgi:hypothetical protein
LGDDTRWDKRQLQIWEDMCWVEVGGCISLAHRAFCLMGTATPDSCHLVQLWEMRQMNFTVVSTGHDVETAAGGGTAGTALPLSWSSSEDHHPPQAEWKPYLPWGSRGCGKGHLGWISTFVNTKLALIKIKSQQHYSSVFQT